MTTEETLAELILEQITAGQEEKRQIVSDEAHVGHITAEAEALLYTLMNEQPTEVYVYRTLANRSVRYQIYDANLDADEFMEWYRYYTLLDVIHTARAADMAQPAVHELAIKIQEIARHALTAE